MLKRADRRENSVTIIMALARPLFWMSERYSSHSSSSSITIIFAHIDVSLCPPDFGHMVSFRNYGPLLVIDYITAPGI